MSILSIEHLSKSYDGKKYALSDCSFTLKEGRICAVVGESGSGKTTLLRLIAGLERPDHGVIKIRDQVVTDATKIVVPQQRHVGLVFQNYALFPHLTVTQNIGFGLKKHQQERVQQLLQLIRLEGYERAYPNQLSGGQAQRVALARTLALQPKLLLLDEPFSNLDASLKSTLRKEIQQIVRQLGTSMLFITHDLFDAIDIADELIFLQNGQLLQHDTIANFSNNSEHQAIQQLLADFTDNAQRTLKFIQ